MNERLAAAAEKLSAPAGEFLADLAERLVECEKSPTTAAEEYRRAPMGDVSTELLDACVAVGITRQRLAQCLDRPTWVEAAKLRDDERVTQVAEILRGPES